MTLREAISRADRVRPNAFTNNEKTAWISALEGRVAANVFLWPPVELFYTRYTWKDNRNIELLVKPPHDDIYFYWLQAKIDEHNGEYDKQQNSMQIFNAHYSDFVRWFAGMYNPSQGYLGGK
jgi:hypothetical protein